MTDQPDPAGAEFGQASAEQSGAAAGAGDENPTGTTLPLDGVLVADFSRVLAGPLATMTLADLGARVIKVERPGAGDDTRKWGPPWSETGATYFESANRNKESVALDLTDPEDLALAKKLALKADVLVENFKPGGLAKLGLGYEDLCGENPGLIYASISGFGSAGGRHLAGYDFLVQAVGGLMSITGPADGSPYKAGVALVDVLCAKDTTIGVLSALEARRRNNGWGSHLEINLLSSLQGALVNQGQAYLGAGKVPSRMGNEHPSIVPYQLLECSDGPLAVTVGNDGQFARMAAALGVAELAEDERFATNTERVAHRDTLVPLLEKALSANTAQHWQDVLTQVGVPAGKVGGIDQGVALAEELGLEPTVDVQDASGTTVGRQFRHPVTWNPPLDTPTAAPPQLGEHKESVVEWLNRTS